MPLVTPSPVTALDGLTPPATSSPLNFDARADAFLGAFPTLQTQINTLADESFTNAEFAQEQAILAEEEANYASDRATYAEEQATAAALAASAALSSAGASMWVSGSYATGALAWSPTSYQVYRRRSPGGASTTDPANDLVNWALAVLAAPQYRDETTAIVTGVVNAHHNLSFPGTQYVTMPTVGLQLGDVLWVTVQNGRADNYLALGGNKVNGEVQDGDVLVLDDPYAGITARWAGATYGWSI